MVSETKIDVRYPDTDAMGIVHHAVYPIWYEVARMDFFAQLGFPYTAMHEKGINPPMVNLNVSFKATVSYPGTVIIRTRCVAFGPKKLKLAYETYNEEGVLVNSAETFHIWTGPDNRSIRLPDVIPTVYNGFRSAIGADKETL